MDVSNFAPAQINTLRRVFKIVNVFMVSMWKLGLGRAINIWPSVGGRIMVIRHRGRKTARERLAPVNYTIADGEVYCIAGFGQISDWYRNIMADPGVELWLPGRRVRARAEDVSDCPRRLFLLRQVIIASGFAARIFAIRQEKMTDDQLAAITLEYRIIHFIQEK